MIKTYFHIITSSGGYGVYSNSNLGLQMQVLNDAFAGSGFSFDYGGGANVQTVANDKWHIHNFGQSQANIDMWKELKVDGPNILNVYVLPELYDNGGQSKCQVLCLIVCLLAYLSHARKMMQSLAMLIFHPTTLLTPSRMEFIRGLAQ